MRDEWREWAACNGMDDAHFFGPDRSDTDRPRWDHSIALKACHSCPVMQECLDDAMRLEAGRPTRWGIRGGLSAKERERLAKGIVPTCHRGHPRTVEGTSWSREGTRQCAECLAEREVR